MARGTEFAMRERISSAEAHGHSTANSDSPRRASALRLRSLAQRHTAISALTRGVNSHVIDANRQHYVLEDAENSHTDTPLGCYYFASISGLCQRIAVGVSKNFLWCNATRSRLLRVRKLCKVTSDRWSEVIGPVGRPLLFFTENVASGRTFSL